MALIANPNRHSVSRQDRHQVGDTEPLERGREGPREPVALDVDETLRLNLFRGWPQRSLIRMPSAALALTGSRPPTAWIRSSALVAGSDFNILDGGLRGPIAGDRDRLIPEQVREDAQLHRSVMTAPRGRVHMTRELLMVLVEEPVAGIRVDAQLGVGQVVSKRGAVVRQLG